MPHGAAQQSPWTRLHRSAAAKTLGGLTRQISRLNNKVRREVEETAKMKAAQAGGCETDSEHTHNSETSSAPLRRRGPRENSGHTQ
jgi:hypothetical protein